MPSIAAGSYFVPDLTRLQELARRYSVAVFAVLFLAVASSGISVGAAYWSAHINVVQASQSASIRIPTAPRQGPNMIVASRQLTASLQKITSQPLSLDVAGTSVPLSPATIKSWIKVVTDQQKGVSYLHVNQSAIAASLKQATAPFVKAPTNQVTATYADGTSAVILPGRNGTQVGTTDQLATQIGANVLQGKGLQLNVPTESVAFAAVTPAAFTKLIEVNVTTKQMYLYDNGQLTRSYPISAGAPATPTPLGEFHVWEKLTIQTMTGFNPDGTKYVQPNVQWINYFDHSGDAVHGNYWRPLSVFGAVNTSHGCVSLPNDEAQWVYNWTPIGTTVITHA
jgi:lipoprotein-anchoring transpeptidase ErfK/SrfK